MYNLLISLAITAVVFAAVAVGFSPVAAIVPALVVFFLANFLLARRISARFQKLVEAAQKEIQARRLDKGIKLLEEGFRFDKWQFMVGAELHSNIGILEYVQKEFARAKPHLEQSSRRGTSGARARAMLGCLHYMDKKPEPMAAAFEQAVKAGKKDGLVWAVYAWCLEKLGKHDDALSVLGRSVQLNPSDEKLKALQVAAQNQKRLKMQSYGPEWYQFHLEKPPMDMGGPGMGGRRIVYQRR